MSNTVSASHRAFSSFFRAAELALATTLLLAGSASAEAASALYNPVYYGKAFEFGTGSGSDGASERTSTIDPVSVSHGSATATTSNDHGGKVTAQLSVIGQKGQIGAQADFWYNLYIIPLTPDAPTDAFAPVHITASGSAHASNYAYFSASSAFIVKENNNPFVNLAAYDSDYTHSIGLPSAFSLDQIYNISVASTLSVKLEAIANFYSPTVVTGGAFATVDPTFTIDDPYWASLYKIVGVPVGADMPPPSAVPEPANWAMMLAGFVMIGGLLRRRSQAEGRARRDPPARGRRSTPKRCSISRFSQRDPMLGRVASL